MSYWSSQIAEALSGAIGSQELPPGVKLGERRLAEICGTSRAVVKQALIFLSREGLVKLIPNRGAFVAEMTGRAALDVFEALAAVEQGVAFQLAERLTGADWAVLEQNVAKAQCCLNHHDDETADRIGQDFHRQLVELAGNPLVSAAHMRLARQSQLLRQRYVSLDHQRQRLNDDHQRIVMLLRAGRIDEALRLIGNHYDQIARGYRIDAAAQPPVPLETVLPRWLARLPAQGGGAHPQPK